MRREQVWAVRRMARRAVCLKGCDKEAESGREFLRDIIAGLCGLRKGI